MRKGKAKVRARAETGVTFEGRAGTITARVNKKGTTNLALNGFGLIRIYIDGQVVWRSDMPRLLSHTLDEKDERKIHKHLVKGVWL